MATTNLAWTATTNCTPSWVQINGKDLPYTGVGSADELVIKASPSTNYNDSTECTITFTSQEGDVAKCVVERCKFTCGCGTYTISEPTTKSFPQTGGTYSSLITVSSNSSCPLNDINMWYDGDLFKQNVPSYKDGKVSVTIKANTSGDLTGNIWFTYGNSEVWCGGGRYLFSQGGVKCDCGNLTVTPSQFKDVSSGGKDGYKVTVSSNCPPQQANKTTIGLIKPSDAGWITITGGGKGTSQTFTIDIKGRSDDNPYAGPRSAILSATSQMDGESLATCGKAIVEIEQEALRCDCEAFDWVKKTERSYTVQANGFTNSAVTDSEYTIKCGPGVVEFYCCSDKSNPKESIVDWATATESHNNGTYKVNLTVKSYGCANNDRTCFIVPVISNGRCGVQNADITITQKPTGPCYTCDGTGFTGSNQTFAYTDSTSTTKEIAKLTLPSNGGKYIATTDESWITIKTGATSVSASTTGTCESGCNDRVGKVKITIQRGDGSACGEAHEVTITQHCSKTLNIEIKEVKGPDGTDIPDKTLTCEGGTVTFEVK